jgi:hypothetical protein
MGMVKLKILNKIRTIGLKKGMNWLKKDLDG